MSSNQNPYASPRAVAIAAEAAVEDRITFIQRTYAHLLVAIVAFVGLEFVLVNMPGAARMVQTMIGGQWSWLIVLGAFMGVSWLADAWARSATSPAMQYLGLSLFVVAQSIIMLPLIYIAANFAGW